MSIDDIPSVARYANTIHDLLTKAVEVKDTGNIEPPLTEADLGEVTGAIQTARTASGEAENTQAHNAAVETAVRDKFYELLASTSIDEPAFGEVWNLLDIVAIISDHDHCEPGLVFWLIEELLDSQTIEGCGLVFDFLESRRERITAKHFKQKSLIILRSCNELLRRLSRAEDTVFCGRVFIFMFQSFPLGDKSSVNLRGEFHVENVTTFDDIKARDDWDVAMSSDDVEATSAVASDGSTTAGPGKDTPQKDSKGATPSSEVDLDVLYPIFWSLQADFSSPTRLFDTTNITTFKKGLEATIDCFKKVPVSMGPGVRNQEEGRRGVKRKHGAEDAEVFSTFNPKYLTSRDLFELEVHDIAFRRHVLVQALIILDFLMSLTLPAKSKLQALTNKSVLYPFTLNEEDAKWVSGTRSAIANYLQQGVGNEGKFYYRMVDTVLSRDKNWVRWKAENCPEIHRPPVNTEQHRNAQSTLEKLCRTHDLPPPVGALDLSFLTKDTGLEGLKDPARFTTPTSESFYDGIMADDLDAEMGTEEEMQLARDARETKIWKALRASNNRFHLCESIDNNRNLQALSGESASPLKLEEPDTAVSVTE